MDELKIIVRSERYRDEAVALMNKMNSACIIEENEVSSDDLVLIFDETGISLESGDLVLKGDFEKLINRIKPGVVNSEMLVKAARIKGKFENLTALDATAGLGEDSLLLAAAGFSVKLYEYNPVIAILLKDTINRAAKHEMLKNIASNMEVIEGDSIEAMKCMESRCDVILLDPMFPERNKSALIGKKFQLLQRLESPCFNEEELINAARGARPRKLVIKRPVKGPNLGGIKPDYVIAGKAVRYDCFSFA